MALARMACWAGVRLVVVMGCSFGGGDDDVMNALFGLKPSAFAWLRRLSDQSLAFPASTAFGLDAPNSTPALKAASRAR